MTASSRLLSALFLSAMIINVLSHGRLEDPPARNFIWRLGYLNPRNVDDNGLNCGGLHNQYYIQGGKCGVCGDPYQGPRYHEASYKGGYANGIIGRVYKTGGLIEVKVVLTANHLGYFTFAICKVENSSVSATEECFDKNPLRGPNGEHEFPVDARDSVIWIKLQLPKSLKCDQCVMQWKYTAGNNAGYAPVQENFVNCADVTINDQGGPQPQPPKPVLAPEETAEPETIDPSLLRDPKDWKCEVMYPYNRGSGAVTMYEWCVENCLLVKPEKRTCPYTHCYCEEKNPKNGEKPRSAAEPYMPNKPYTKLTKDKEAEEQAERVRRAELLKKWECEVVPPFNRTEESLRETHKWCLESCVFTDPYHRNCAPTHCKCYKKTGETEDQKSQEQTTLKSVEYTDRKPISSTIKELIWTTRKPEYRTLPPETKNSPHNSRQLASKFKMTRRLRKHRRLRAIAD